MGLCVRHIILASPAIDYRTGMHMLKDVANTGADLIKTTLGSDSSSAMKPASVLCSSDCTPKPHMSSHNRRRGDASRKRKNGKKKRGPSKLCVQEGPCKYHGPNSFHATSECRDPTLSKRKQCPTRENLLLPRRLLGLLLFLRRRLPQDYKLLRFILQCLLQEHLKPRFAIPVQGSRRLAILPGTLVVGVNALSADATM